MEYLWRPNNLNIANQSSTPYLLLNKGGSDELLPIITKGTTDFSIPVYTSSHLIAPLQTTEAPFDFSLVFYRTPPPPRRLKDSVYVK